MKFISQGVRAAFVLLMLGSTLVAQDMIEFTSGAKVRGKVLKIDKDGKQVTFESKIGTRTIQRVYSYSRIRSIIYQGKTYVLTSSLGAGGTKPSTNSAATSTTKAAGDSRTPQEVKSMIQSVGSTPPDWLNSTRLNFPRTLDLSWPQASGPWNTQKNVGQYLWSVINENPGRWKEGVKFLHHLLSVNSGNSTVETKTMIALADKYHNLFQDYVRAAYWYEKAKVDSSPPRGNPVAPVRLAECYWKLGSSQLAMGMMNRMPFRFEGIKLLADMGDVSNALRIADSAIRTSDPYTVGQASLYAGDACRTAGKFDQALGYYRKTLSLSSSDDRLKKRLQRIQDRARASITAVQVFDLSDVKNVADGTYRSSSQGYEAQVHVEVVVKGGKITSVRVTQHREKQFYSALTDTPNKIIAKQGVKGVDTTSSATITSEAIINATAKALAGK